MPERTYTMKWWGWGDPLVRFDLKEYPGILSFLKEKLGISGCRARPCFDVEKVRVPPSRVSPEVLEKFVRVLGQERVSVSHSDRTIHSLGKSYKDLIRLRSFRLTEATDIVLFPESEGQITKIFDLCSDLKVSLVPFGGGTSVVGGVEPEKGSFEMVATLSMVRMNRILEIDRESHMVTVEAGIFGPELEKELSKAGFTLGHFPQSFEFSTVGGWIAAKSSGQNSILYGGIEKRVISLRMLTPGGAFTTLPYPRRADGPNPNEIAIGSEGIFGVISRATLRVSPIPHKKDYFMVAFKSFEESARAARDIVQSDMRPAMIRVSDEDETGSMLAMGGRGRSRFSSVLARSAETFLKFRGFYPPGMSIFLIGFEGSSSNNRAERKKLRKILRSFKTLYLGKHAGKKWLNQRFFLPYLRDELLDHGVLVDTLETAAPWSGLDGLYRGVREAILQACRKDGGSGEVFSHISHLYSDGASLYFSVMARQKKGQEMEQWKEIKRAASEAVKRNGGIISHHHGIGVDHREYLDINEQGLRVIAGIKETLDPAGIMNPGKLL